MIGRGTRIEEGSNTMSSGPSTHSGSSTSSTTGLPHLSHAEPWAHNYICCDSEHQASTSRGSTPITRFSSRHQSHPSITSTQSFNANASCCDETQCSTGDVVECCTDPSCSQGAICEDEGCHDPHAAAPLAGGFDNAESMRQLEEWACSKEGCHAIQQYLQCCTQDDCALPVCTDPHPAPVVCNHDSTPQHSGNDPNFMTLSATPVFQPNIFDPSQLPPAPWPQPLSANNISQNNNNLPPPGLQNVCHWQNCHQVFGTTPDLLAHIASDHLNAPAAMPLGGSLADVNTSTTGLMQPMQSLAENNQLNQQPFDFSNLQLDNAGVDSLMSCLWDDCFPTGQDISNNNNVFTTNYQSGMNNQINQNSQTGSGHAVMQQPLGNGVNFGQATAMGPNHHQTHSHVLPQAHPHSHSHLTGEPFSPQTMLRHVLEEHLGLTAGELAWTNQMVPPPVPTSTPILPSISSASTTPVVTPQHSVKPHHHHIPILPTPSPSTYTASPPPPSKPLFCMWPGCTACSAFPDTGSLMVHLSEEHIGKCKNTYTCLWDTCGHSGGREFKSRQKVLRHLQSHVGHRPYICDVCDQAFSEAAPLAAHKRRHAQEKPFKCEYPGCDKTFAISSSLTIHMRTHNGEKPFICPHCDKGFVEASNLTKHIRTHTGERPFACSYAGCGKRFPRPDQLKRHMAVHDADRPGKGRRHSAHSSISTMV